MRKMIYALAATAIAAPATAQGVGGIILDSNNSAFEDSYANRGQCQSAFAHVRGDQRKDPATRGSPPYDTMSKSEYNRESLTTTRCELIDGEYSVVFYVDGF